MPSYTQLDRSARCGLNYNALKEMYQIILLIYLDTTLLWVSYL